MDAESCVTCGEPTERDAAFCTQCGTPSTRWSAPGAVVVSAHDAGAPTAHGTAATDDSAPSPNFLKRWWREQQAIAEAAAAEAHAKAVEDPESLKHFVDPRFPGARLVRAAWICALIAPVAVVMGLLAVYLAHRGEKAGHPGAANAKSFAWTMTGVGFMVVGWVFAIQNASSY